MFFILKLCRQFGFSSSFVNVTDFSILKNLAAQILGYENSDVSVFLFVDGIQIDENDYLCTLENWTELFICKACHREKLLIYFDIKKNISSYNAYKYVLNCN